MTCVKLMSGREFSYWVDSLSKMFVLHIYDPIAKVPLVNIFCRWFPGDVPEISMTGSEECFFSFLLQGLIKCFNVGIEFVWHNLSLFAPW